MWWASLLTAPFGVTQALFVGPYWDPPGILSLSRIAHCDVESFLFCFGIGGVAEALYNVIFRAPVRIPPKLPRHGPRQQWYVFALLFPFLAYLPVLVLSDRPLWSGVAVMAAGAAVRVGIFPGLRAKTLWGGVLFLGYYAAFLGFLQWLSPGYVGRVWSGQIPGGRVLGVPWAEPCFAFTFGLFWSGIYEQVLWIFLHPQRILGVESADVTRRRRDSRRTDASNGLVGLSRIFRRRRGRQRGFAARLRP
jgi:hypothetical protein